MIIIKKSNVAFTVATFNKNVQLYVLLTLLLTFVMGCTSSNNKLTAPIAEKLINEQKSIKGPYEIADEENIPSVVSYQAPEDSLRFINEPIFNFNDLVYRNVLSPLAHGYESIVPKPVDLSIRNFFYNLREPLYALNHLLQGNISKSGQSLIRVLVNSTIGFFGLFDPANSTMEITRDKTTFGETLASYGVGHGVYLVLPLLGPSDLRDTASLSFNYFTHPLNFIHDDKAAQQLLIIDGIHSQTPILSKYPHILSDIDNPYEFTRNLYMQSLQRDGQARRNEIFKTEKQKQLNTTPLVE